MKRLPIVGDYTDTKVYTLQQDQDILEAVDFLLRHSVTGAPVVDKGDRLLGIFTEMDCMRLLSEGAHAEPPQGPVSEFMTTEVTTIPPEMDIYFAAGLFLNNIFRRLVVLEEEKVVGAITRFDILRAIQANRNLFRRGKAS